MRNAVILALLACCTAGCSQPMGPIAGGALEGDVSQWPADWEFTDDIENVLLETNPDDPYSVTIWGVTNEGDFYVGASSVDNQWAQNIAADDRVRLSVEGSLYDARATRVTDATKIKSVLPAYIEKYDYEATFNEEGALYRIERR